MTDEIELSDYEPIVSDYCKKFGWFTVSPNFITKLQGKRLIAYDLANFSDEKILDLIVSSLELNSDVLVVEAKNAGGMQIIKPQDDI